MSVMVTLAIIGIVGGAADGLRRAYNSYCNNSEAERLHDEGKRSYEEAVAAFQTQMENTKKSLETLGELKLNIWANDLNEFQRIFKDFKNVELKEVDYAKGLGINIQNVDEIKEIEISALNASEILGAGIASLTTGALAGVGAYAGAMGLAYASTGTAIATLHGVAATNATLAWFGGGALAAGGGGIALGTVVLGGIVVAPALFAAGFILERNSEANLAKAKEDYAKNIDKVKEVEFIVNFMREVELLSNEFIEFLKKYRERFQIALKSLRNIRDEELTKRSFIKNMLIKTGLASDKIDYKSLKMKPQEEIHITVLMAILLHELMKMPLLNNKQIGEGDNMEEKSEINLEAQKKLTEGKNFLENV